MDDPSFTVMDELARTSGVVGVERLAALFTPREPEAARTMGNLWEPAGTHWETLGSAWRTLPAGSSGRPWETLASL